MKKAVMVGPDNPAIPGQHYFELVSSLHTHNLSGTPPSFYTHVVVHVHVPLHGGKLSVQPQSQPAGPP